MGVKRKPPKTLEQALARSLDAEDVRKLRDAILDDALNKSGLTPPTLISESRKLINQALQRANVEYAAAAKQKAVARPPKERIAEQLAELHAHARVAGSSQAALEALKGEAAAAQALGEAMDLTAKKQGQVRPLILTYSQAKLLEAAEDAQPGIVDKLAAEEQRERQQRERLLAEGSSTKTAKR